MSGEVIEWPLMETWDSRRAQRVASEQEGYTPYNAAEHQLLWTSPGGENNVIGLCPHGERFVLTRDDARMLAEALLRWADGELDP